MRRPGLTRSVRDLLRERREPTYPVDGGAGWQKPVAPPSDQDRPAGLPVHARRRTPVVSTSLTDYTDAQLILLADEVGRELRRRRIRART